MSSQDENNTTDERVKSFEWKFWIFAVIIIALVLLLPFIYPIFAKVLIKIGAFKEIDEISKSISIFKEFYWIIISGIVVAIILYFTHNKEFLQKILSSVSSIAVKNGDNELLLKFMQDGYKKEVKDNIEDSKKQAKELLSNLSKYGEQLSLVTKIESTENKENREIEKIKEERDNMRIFVADRITNKCCKNILKKISSNGKIEVEKFREELENYYKKSIKNIHGKKKETYIINKVNELLSNLKYLNIIEYSEDDNYIILTKDGMEFVNSCLEGVG